MKITRRTVLTAAALPLVPRAPLRPQRKYIYQIFSLGGNRTIASPSVVTTHETLTIRLTKDGKSRTVSWGPNYKFTE